MTTTIDRLMAVKDGLSRSEFVGLTAADIADLTSRAGDRVNPNQMRAVNSLAMVALADTSVADALAEVVEQVLIQPGIDAFQRAAVLSFAAAAGSNAYPVLLSATADPNTDVAVTAWRSLQLAARSANLPELEQAAPGPGSAAGDQAAFTIALVAYRAGVAGYELPIPDDTDVVALPTVKELYSINQSNTTPTEFAQIKLLSYTEMYLIDPELAATTTITCGDAQLLLCLDPNIQVNLPPILIEGPALAGIIATRDPLGDGYAVRHLILTTPDGTGGFHVVVYLPGGDRIYWGHSHAEDITTQSAPFSLWALDRPGVRPISLDLTATTSGIQLEGDRLSTVELLTDRLEPTPARNW